MRAIVGKLSVLVLASGLAGSAIVAGCSSNSDEKSQTANDKNQGSIGFQLDIGGGATINGMHVVVFGNSLGASGASTNVVKDLDVSAISGATTAFTLTLPAGTNYQVALSSPDNATCHGTGTFSVLAGQSSTIAVTLSCTSADNTGNTTIGVTACTPPIVDSVFVGPNTQVVGHVVQLAAVAESGSTYQWTSSGTGAGTFANSAAASTGFTCTSAGSVQIQLGLTKNGCSTSKSYAVTCTTSSGGGAGGSGGGGAGGSSGAASGGASSGGASSGGASSGGASSGGASSGGASSGGASSGGASSGGASSGGATSGGASSGGASSGGATSGGSGGSGGTCPAKVDNAEGTGQVCSAAFTIDECGTNCSQITTDACQACEKADTSACYDDGSGTNGSLATDGSSLLNMAAAIAYYGGVASPARVQAGIAAEACIYSTGCANNSPVFTGCYCGTSGSACTTQGSANGPCKAQLEAALDTTAPLVIATNIGDPSFGGGVAQVRVACDQTQCKSVCLH